jgi:hypothetical protein
MRSLSGRWKLRRTDTPDEINPFNQATLGRVRESGNRIPVEAVKTTNVGDHSKAGCDGMGNGTVWCSAGSGDREGAKTSRVDSEAADFF